MPSVRLRTRVGFEVEGRWSLASYVRQALDDLMIDDQRAIGIYHSIAVGCVELDRPSRPIVLLLVAWWACSAQVQGTIRSAESSTPHIGWCICVPVAIR